MRTRVLGFVLRGQMREVVEGEVAHASGSAGPAPPARSGAWLAALASAPAARVDQQGNASDDVRGRLGPVRVAREMLAPAAPTQARAYGMALSALIHTTTLPQSDPGPLAWMDWERRKTLRLLLSGR